MRTLNSIPSGARVEIDATRSMSIDYDVYEVPRNFQERARHEGIHLTVHGLDHLRRNNDSMRRVHRVIRRERKRAERHIASSLRQGAA